MLFAVGAVALIPAGADAEPAADEIRQLICQTVDHAAVANRLPPAFLARVLWQESRFQADVTSRAGAEGIAQFMPKTALERGLLDARQVRPAITEAARFLADLSAKFGNLGLAAAAYNAGAARVALWLHGQSPLPSETSNYVVTVTGRPADDWARPLSSQLVFEDRRPCLQVVADLSVRGTGWSARLERVLARALVLAMPSPPRRSPAASESTRAAEGLCTAIRSLGARCAVY